MSLVSRGLVGHNPLGENIEEKLQHLRGYSFCDFLHLLLVYIHLDVEIICHLPYPRLVIYHALCLGLNQSSPDVSAIEKCLDTDNSSNPQIQILMLNYASASGSDVLIYPIYVCMEHDFGGVYLSTNRRGKEMRAKTGHENFTSKHFSQC